MSRLGKAYEAGQGGGAERFLLVADVTVVTRGDGAPAQPAGPHVMDIRNTELSFIYLVKQSRKASAISPRFY